MREWLTWLLTVDSRAEEVQRQGRNIIVLSLGLIVLVLLFIPVLLFQPGANSNFMTLGVALVLFMTTLLLARRGQVMLAGILLTVSLTVIIFVSMVTSRALGVTPFYLFLSVLVASLVLRPWHIWLVLGIDLLGLLLSCLTLPSNPLADRLGYQVLTGSSLTMCIVALMAFLGASTANTALRSALHAQTEAERAAAEAERAAAEARRLEQAETESRRILEQDVMEYLAFIQRVAQGDLRQRLDIKGDAALGQLGQGLNGMVESLQRITSQMQQATSAIAAAAAEILAATTQQAASAAEQSAALTQTTTTIEEVKVIAQQTAERAAQVALDGQAALQVARQGTGAVEETVSGMSQIRARVESIATTILALAEQTQAIGTIITTVSELADQSNLLALNAAIEAARAGEQGKSFAVVAQHVRALAERSKGATAQVKEILSEIQKATQTAVLVTEEGTKGVEAGGKLAASAGQVIHKIAGEVEGGAQASVQIAAAATQQTAGMAQIGQAMEAIAQATTQALMSTRQAERAAQDLHTLALSLQKAIAAYQL
jgi:methyl-accepting chemotaxis protein